MPNRSLDRYSTISNDRFGINLHCTINFILTAKATHSYLQIMLLFLVLLNYVLFSVPVFLPALFVFSQRNGCYQPKKNRINGRMRFFKEISAWRMSEEGHCGLETTQVCGCTVDAPFHHVHLNGHPNVVLGKCATFRLRKWGVNVEGFVRSQSRCFWFQWIVFGEWIGIVHSFGHEWIPI